MRRGLMLGCLLWGASALAYRPFDQTDADVAELQNFEIEFGPAQVRWTPHGLRYVPNLTLNYGLAPRLELVLDTAARLDLPRGGWEVEPELLAKYVLRRGSLQEATGISLALEGGVFTPEPASPRPAEDAHFGASLALIGSYRWKAVTLHVNLYGAYQEDEWQAMLGGIIEGPHDWKVRPVGEVFYEREGDLDRFSALAGLIYEPVDTVVFDAALRASELGRNAGVEARVGVTWTFSVGARPTGPTEGR